MYNTRLFCLKGRGPDGNGYRVVQDFRPLNKLNHLEPVQFKKMHENLAMVEQERPRFFSTLDLSDYAWQMRLNQEQASATAFTLPGKGQYQWTQTPLGILGAEASFHRLSLGICRKSLKADKSRQLSGING
jgi:hypothetical protein